MKRQYQLAPRVRVVAVHNGDALPYFGQAIRRAEDVWQLLREEVALWDRERFLALALDGRHCTSSKSFGQEMSLAKRRFFSSV